MRTPAAAITFLANAFDPSIRAASLEGRSRRRRRRAARRQPRAPAVSRADHHQIRPHPAGQRNNFFRRGDVDRVLLGDQRGPGVARRDGQRVDFRVVA
ncbi:hypothetical protein I552_2696 [Mycobacterium xenopi 3993]|nr:hypothetical protein I552_2696 [Mycobacterium xenopi 3993]